MKNSSFWSVLFNAESWADFKSHGAKTTGFREKRWKTVKKIKLGDRLICYMTGVSRYFAILEVTKTGYRDDTYIWQQETFPCRLEVKLICELTPLNAVPVLELREVLSFFENLAHPHAWSAHFRASPNKMKDEDGLSVQRAIIEATTKPVARPFDERKLKYKPAPIPTIETNGGQVTIPETDNETTLEVTESIKGTEHTEIQYNLLKLGSDMGFDIWVARNDKNKSWDSNKFAHISHLQSELPVHFDEATNRTIELIDVLWLKGQSIVAAFEVESTTSIYSGLLRMSDLVSMQPNIKIPLFLVAPDERRDKVRMEVNRPTFSRLAQPLSVVCRFISFNTLREQIKQVQHLLKYIKPEFLNEISESCMMQED